MRLAYSLRTATDAGTATLSGHIRLPAAKADRSVGGPDPLVVAYTTTDSRSRTVNRIHKVDRTLRPQDIRAGYVRTAALFAPPEYEPNLPRTTFRLPPKPNKMTAAVETHAPAEPIVEQPSDAPTVESLDPAPRIVATAYAPAKETDGVVAPFDAVIATPKIRPKTVVVPDVGRNHTWVNSPIPRSAYAAKEKKCLATAIYFEARSEPEDGQLAVAQVVLNRLKNPAYPSTICGVVYQNKNKRNRCQFSFACDGIRDRVNDQRSWSKAEAIAARALKNDKSSFLADVGAATHYHATYVRPRWASHMKKMDKIGRHIFYQTYGGGWS